LTLSETTKIFHSRTNLTSSQFHPHDKLDGLNDAINFVSDKNYYYQYPGDIQASALSTITQLPSGFDTDDDGTAEIHDSPAAPSTGLYRGNSFGTPYTLGLHIAERLPKIAVSPAGRSNKN
jgi:hypothetical protein